MKSKLSLFLSLILVATYSSVFAAEVTGTEAKAWSTEVTASWVKTADVKVDTSTATEEKWIDTTTEDASIWADEELPMDSDTNTKTEEDLNAAWWTATPSKSLAPKWVVGNYSEVACDKDFFTQNTCNQCFEWGKKMVWEKIAWLTDSWTNPNTTEQVIYKDEQKLPEFVNLGWAGTIWANNPIEVEKFWKYNDEIVWTDSAEGAGKQEFLLEWGKTVNYLEADLGASYALSASDKKEWDAIGLLKFNVNYHDTDATGKEIPAKMHTECVAYYAWASTPNPVAPAPVTPVEVTKVKTGPESFVLIIVALLLSLVLIKYRKKA